MQTVTDEVLAARCQLGESAAVGALYERYVTPMLRFCAYRIGSREVAEDVTADIFVKVFAKIHSFHEEKGSFRSWLYTLARNTVISHQRQHRYTAVFDEAYHESVEMPGKIEDWTELFAALDKLQPLQREILTMRFWDELPFEEIASITGKTSTACRMQASRALHVLRETLPLSAYLLFILSKSHL